MYIFIILPSMLICLFEGETMGGKITNEISIVTVGAPCVLFINQIQILRMTNDYRENYCVLPEYYKCVLPPLTLMVGLTN